MCVVCGCNAPTDPSDLSDPFAQGAGVTERHPGTGAAPSSVPDASQARTVKLEADVLGANQRLADRNRAHFAAQGVTAYNLVSSPGAGKTTLLCATIAALRRCAAALPLAVIEGDQQTRLDAERIRAAGAPAIQLTTGRGCHLDAKMVGDAFGELNLHAHAHAHAPAHDHDQAQHHDHPDAQGHSGAALGPEALLFIENVGNLVCPALWDLGERAKLVILSVTEGDDKPLKYPDMFAAASLMLINKIDLLPHVDFKVDRCIAHARQIHPQIQVLQVSATRGDGLQAWIDWLLHRPAQAGIGQPHTDLSHTDPSDTDPSHTKPGNEAALRKRIAALEARLATLQPPP